MIERAVGCLENGGRYLLRLHKKSSPSRRSLHSGFWCHGAAEIDLPTWWLAFLQARPVSGECWPSEGPSKVVDNVLSGMQGAGFLDFLYPAQSLASIRRFVKMGRPDLKPHRLARKTLHSSRAYTSSASDGPEATTADDVIQNNVIAANSADLGKDGSTTAQRAYEFSQDLGSVRARFTELLDSGGTDVRRNEVWHVYQNLRNLLKEPTPREIIKLLRYLSASQISVNAERVMAVVSDISRETRRAIHYNYAISAALSQDDLKTGAAFHREALSRIQGHVGTASLLRYSVEREMWKEAIETWHEYWNHKQRYFECPNLWKELESLPLPTLLDKAASVADFALEMSAEAPAKTAALVGDFAIQMILRIFNIQTERVDLVKHEELFEKAVLLNAPLLGLFRAAICQLLPIKSKPAIAAALGYYLRLKKTEPLFPDKRLLDALFDKFIAIHSSAGILMILDDYRRYTQGPPATVLYVAMGEFSRQGDIEKVWNLFHEYAGRYGKPRGRRIYDLILSAYCKRGEIGNIIRNFHDLQDDYGFDPDIKSWNAVIATHARVGDIDGALTWYDNLIEAGMQPNSYTYSFLMSMYARRGDLESVLRLLQQSEASHIQPSISMIDSVVLAQAKNDQLDDACKLVEEALQMDLKGSRTRMWNYLLNAYAMRRDLEKVRDLHKRMREKDIQPDSITFAALMHGLHGIHPNAAWKILAQVLPRAGIQPSPIHYAVCMSGFLRSKQYPDVFKAYRHMMEHDINPAFSPQKMLLIAAVNEDLGRTRSSREKNSQRALKEIKLAEEILDKTLAIMDPIEFAAGEPIKYLGPNRLDEAYSSAYFTHMVLAYGRHKTFDKVRDIYDRYIATAKKFQPNDNISPPVEMISALMVANLLANDHHEVERCWHLALSKANQFARPRSPDRLKPGLVSYAYRFILNDALSCYMRSLEQLKMIDALTDTVDSLRRSGYELDNHCWNKYIRILSRNGREMLAYELCEKELMDDWPGWRALGTLAGMRKKLRRKMPKPYQKFRRMPGYATFVYLTRNYVEIRSEGGREKLEALRNVAPRAVNAVTSMPKTDDAMQVSLLRSF